MYDLVSIGNIAIDLFFKGESLTYKDDRFQLAVGGKYFVDEFRESLGGGGANVAVGAAHFGLNTAVCAKVGDNVFKQIIIQKLIKNNVSTEFLLHEKNYLNISSIYLTDKGERTIVNYQNQNSELFINPIMMDHMLETKCVFMGNLPDTPLEERMILLKRFKEKKSLIILNLGVNDCRRKTHDLDQLLDLADIFIINKYEYADFIKKKPEEIDLKSDCGKKIKFENKLLVITDSKTGSYAYYEGKISHQEAIKQPHIVDTTGAGDAFASAFIAMYLQNKKVEESLKAGAEYASQILGQYGAE